jgi:hypothetical protein
VSLNSLAALNLEAGEYAKQLARSPRDVRRSRPSRNIRAFLQRFLHTITRNTMPIHYLEIFFAYFA